jgi:hypothetical protein
MLFGAKVSKVSLWEGRIMKCKGFACLLAFMALMAMAATCSAQGYWMVAHGNEGFVDSDSTVLSVQKKGAGMTVLGKEKTKAYLHFPLIGPGVVVPVSLSLFIKTVGNAAITEIQVWSGANQLCSNTGLAISGDSLTTSYVYYLQGITSLYPSQGIDVVLGIDFGKATKTVQYPQIQISSVGMFGAIP